MDTGLQAKAHQSARKVRLPRGALRPQLLSVSETTGHIVDAALVSSFANLYETHIRREEAELLPMAARLLSEIELDRIGVAMRARRGIASTEAHQG